ncbi:hypothetical protein CXG81DRAFT_13506 [Caulochytrium protostelioides]|uniref:GH26 domain-containing protein n=1 Tax=Caulochytrium protostelioides TaxID=1555241 RepID=A0A4P9X514_9FUNG|nr:hypothetical protein CXG81DRAFT_13506 [Caulochytrium protostelioides]|eukprot:RKP00207.1 hypothetical protein CXG81DRAFT_13506 [Caulochytrium protostelioides]
MAWRVEILHRRASNARHVIDFTRDCATAASAAHARLENPKGTMVGFHIDWSQDTPDALKSRIGAYPAVVNTFITFDAGAAWPWDRDMLVWQAQLAGEAGAVLEITVMPVDLGRITAQMYADFAATLRTLNEQYHTPVLLRWAHEMNGNWLSYSYKPAQYIASFQQMATAVHAATNATAMVWSPNMGLGYPFGDDATTIPRPTRASDPTNFALLDTNGDGVISNGDDPYLPFYPGDDYVDWVGLSLYWYPAPAGVLSETPNQVTPPNFVADYIRGSGGNVNPSLNASVITFYDRFVEGRGKPMMLAESGAPFLVTQGGASELDVKKSWWEQTWNTALMKEFPRLRAIINFDERKEEGGLLKDWAQTTNSAVLKAYKSYMGGKSKLTTYGNDMSFACDGRVTML